LVLVSKHEGTPNVVLEAMASGLPVATLQMEGIEELITPDISGITEENLSKLALKSAQVLTNSHHKKVLVENARQKMETDFALTTQIANFESILLQLK
jgi:glycosyltransferase involved in cell wall biosynthesis